MEKKRNKILVISYFANLRGCCPAEWLNDKVEVLLEEDYDITLLTSSVADKIEKPVKHFRVPSLSYKEFLFEESEISKEGRTSRINLFWWPIASTLGRFFDFLLSTILRGESGGMWSWSITSFVTTSCLVLFNRFDLIYTTGGPASSHLTGVLAAWIFRKKVVVELQDPLVGEGIGRNSKSAKLLNLFEKFIVKRSTKIIYVTKRAYSEAVKRNPLYKNKLKHLYPGARNFKIESKDEKQEGKFTLLHLGTLYSTRNFDALIKAIDLLIDQEKISDSDISLENRGAIHLENYNDYLSKPYFKHLEILPRVEAIKELAEADLSLLIQHMDPRSLTTIPYKTYDYLNINQPILGLVNNDELKDLLLRNGHYSTSANEIEEIAEHIFKLYQMKKKKIDLNLDKIIINEQVKLMLTL